MKCDHDACQREAVDGEMFCSECVPLPSKECNFCSGGLPENKELRKMADDIQNQINRSNKPWWKFW